MKIYTKIIKKWNKQHQTTSHVPLSVRRYYRQRSGCTIENYGRIADGQAGAHEVHGVRYDIIIDERDRIVRTDRKPPYCSKGRGRWPGQVGMSLIVKWVTTGRLAAQTHRRLATKTDLKFVFRWVLSIKDNSDTD